MIKNRKECLQKADPVHDVIFFLSKCGGGGGKRMGNRAEIKHNIQFGAASLSRS